MRETGINYFKAALTRLKSGAYEEAIDHFDKAINCKMDHYSIISTNSFTVSEWEYLEDITFCEKQIRNNCKNDVACLAISLLFKIANNYERRLDFLHEAKKLNPMNNRIWRELGETLFHQNEVREALNCFNEAIFIEQDDPVSREAIGLCYYYLDEPHKAITPLKKSLELQPNNHATMNRLAFILSEVGELDEAEEVIKKALELEPKNHSYLDTYACIMYLQERHQEALELFEEIIKDKPDDLAVSWDILSCLYEEMGMHARAKILESKLG